MKKVLITLLISISVLVMTGCENPFNKKEEPKEMTDLEIKEAKELPKKVFRQLETYVKQNNIKLEPKGEGNFDITKVNIGNTEELYLNENSSYYVSNGDIFMNVEYIYNKKYLCKMTIRDNENNIGSFNCELLDKEN